MYTSPERNVHGSGSMLSWVQGFYQISSDTRDRLLLSHNVAHVEPFTSRPDRVGRESVRESMLFIALSSRRANWTSSASPCTGSGETRAGRDTRTQALYPLIYGTKFTALHGRPVLTPAWRAAGSVSCFPQIIWTMEPLYAFLTRSMCTWGRCIWS